MNILRLKSEVVVEGRDFWGRKARIVFYPNYSGANHWLWYSRLGIVPISPTIIDGKCRRARLFSNGGKLEIYEHLGVLRWFGLLGLSIWSTDWPPYFGRSLEFWQKIKSACEIDHNSEIPWYTPKEGVIWTYPRKRGGVRAFTEILPNKDGKLELTVVCSYKGLGEKIVQYCFPDDNGSLESLCSFGNAGLPKVLYYLSEIVSSKFGWPHHKTAVWQQEVPKGEALKQITFHRVADLLGCLSLLCRDGLLSAKVLSVYSGHQGDIGAIMKAQELLKSVP